MTHLLMTNLRSQRKLERVGLALYVMLLTVLLASVVHGLATLMAI